MDCDSSACCGHWLCARWRPVKKVFFGLLLLSNAFFWPLWSGVDGWVTWFAVLLTVWGIITLFKCGGSCGQSCSTSAPATVAKKKRR